MPSKKKTSKAKTTKSKTTIKKDGNKCFINCTTNNCDKGCGGAIYFLGWLGATIYYISTTTGFWIGVWGAIKALVWPAILIFNLFKMLGL